MTVESPTLKQDGPKSVDHGFDIGNEAWGSGHCVRYTLHQLLVSEEHVEDSLDLETL